MLAVTLPLTNAGYMQKELKKQVNILKLINPSIVYVYLSIYIYMLWVNLFLLILSFECLPNCDAPHINEFKIGK